MTNATVKTAKPENYSAEQTAVLVSAYQAAKAQGEEAMHAVVEQFAATFGKSVRSIVAKLARERDSEGNAVYVKPTRKAKDGSPVVKKDGLADAIGAILGNMTAEDVDSLTKANKKVLKAIFDALANSKPLEG